MRAATTAFVEQMGEIPPDVETRRERGERARLAPLPPHTTVEPVDAGGVPAEWLWADGVDDRRVVVVLHFGGYIAGNAAGMRRFSAAVSERLDATILGVDYRLAPEHPFPAAWDDVVAAYRWLLDRRGGAAGIGFLGASAGGGLAVGAMLAARDRGLPMPAALVAISPWADLTLTAATIRSPEHPDPFAADGEFERLAAYVLPDGDRAHPWASPALADLTGIPPIHAEVGTADRLLDDARQLVAAARRAGVQATLEVTDEAIHCFPIHTPDTPESRSALDRTVTHLAKWIGASNSCE